MSGRQIPFNASAEEAEAISILAADAQLSEEAVLRQGLRLYQLHVRRLKQGETVTWSGDEARARAFAGPLNGNRPGA